MIEGGAPVAGRGNDRGICVQDVVSQEGRCVVPVTVSESWRCGRVLHTPAAARFLAREPIRLWRPPFPMIKQASVRNLRDLIFVLSWQGIARVRGSSGRNELRSQRGAFDG